jgi:hypothetical protein
MGADYNNLGPDGIQNAGAALTLTNDYSNKVINLNNAAGSIITLPPATGSGVMYKFLQTYAAPSSPHIIKVSANALSLGAAGDQMIGIITTVDSATVTGYVAANSATQSTNSDTITLSATTSGGLNVGTWIDVQDVLPNTWSVRGLTSSSGTAISPFSASV